MNRRVQPITLSLAILTTASAILVIIGLPNWNIDGDVITSAFAALIGIAIVVFGIMIAIDAIKQRGRRNVHVSDDVDTLPETPPTETPAD